jgi:hypothetical protein
LFLGHHNVIILRQCHQRITTANRQITKTITK